MHQAEHCNRVRNLGTLDGKALESFERRYDINRGVFLKDHLDSKVNNELERDKNGN